MATYTLCGGGMDILLLASWLYFSFRRQLFIQGFSIPDIASGKLWKEEKLITL